MTVHDPALVAAVVAAIRNAQRYDSDPAGTARKVLDALEARRPVVESREDAVRVVEDIIDAHTMTTEHSGAVVLSDQTATRIVDALLGEPLGTTTYESDGALGTVTLAWPRPENVVALVSRELLESVVRDLNARTRVLAERDRELATAHAQINRLRRLGADADDALVEGHLERLEALVIARRPALEPSDPGQDHATADDFAHLEPLRTAVRNTIDRLEAELTSPDCKAGKCSACTGDAWSDRLDARADCEHPCHAARVERDADEEPST